MGNDPASQVYVRHKQQRCQEVGIESILIRLSEETTQTELLETIKTLNTDSSVHGILLQLPLPHHFDTLPVINSIHPLKDVDGLTAENLGLLFAGSPRIIPCTPLGCIKLLNQRLSLKGKNVVVVGRSILVGRPFSALLTYYDATVTLAHSHTTDLPRLCQDAEILVVAIGKPSYLNRHYIRKDSLIIDVGINRIHHQGKTKLVGDVDFDDVFDLCSAITPVPGGVGPLTVANLMKNVLLAYELQQ